MHRFAIHTHGALLEQLCECLIAANFGHSWRLEKCLSNPEDGLSWRTDIIGVDNKNRMVLIDATITCLSSQSNLNSRVADSQGRTLAGLKAAENRKKRDPHIQSPLSLCPRMEPSDRKLRNSLPWSSSSSKLLACSVCATVIKTSSLPGTLHGSRHFGANGFLQQLQLSTNAAFVNS